MKIGTDSQSAGLRENHNFPWRCPPKIGMTIQLLTEIARGVLPAVLIYEKKLHAL